MKSSVYDQHDKTFSDVMAYVVLDDKRERVATIAFKTYPSGAVHAFVHWIGLEMTKATAKGFGYDKRTAAAASAARQITNIATLGDDKTQGRALDFREALSLDGGQHWDGALRDAGFIVWQAV
ncbi:hypothetical protein [Bradyrhizobium sp. BR 10289]|uniref:hypothetical protein n=1 Tax=Bradyrhizobium sp. BR 10289 TaxID=2749993 RepID=UPI001C653B1F|nr:hypothetical protein [Bradyrhizobium sp. BR 10289]MBW7970941.1 hypothetical protein [Bradyrhizobium sp. BR 10289]